MIFGVVEGCVVNIHIFDWGGGGGGRLTGEPEYLNLTLSRWEKRVLNLLASYFLLFFRNNFRPRKS